MNFDLKEIIQDPTLSDEVKKTFVAELFKERADQRDRGVPLWRSLILSAPAWAAVASILGALGSGVFAYLNLNSRAQLDAGLERQKFEFEIIRLALNENKSPQERANALKFFKISGLLPNVNIEKVDVKEIPALSATGIFSKQRLYLDTMEVISLLLDEQQYLSPDSKAYAQFWHLYRTALIGIESLEVAKAMINFGKVLETLGESRSKPTGDFRNLAAAVLDQMSKEVEELKPTADKILKRPPSTQ